MHNDADMKKNMKRTSPGSGFLAAFCSGMMLLLAAGPVVAQQVPNLTPDQMQQLIQNATPDQLQELQRRGFAVPGNSAPAVPPAPTVLAPAAPRSGPEPAQSALETALSARAGLPLRQFGYDQVGVGGSVSVPQTGAVQDDYILGPGDEIDVALRGQENNQYSLTVDRNGQVALPKTGPVMAAGKSLGQFRQDLSAAVGHAYVATQAYISVGQLRQVTVLVAGEVANPGMRILTGLSNPLDALLLSGGIKKSGSLRNVELIRRGRTIIIDLYAVLAQRGSARLENLQDGDRVFVPPIGATVAIAGYVRRPAIYELPAGRRTISAVDLLALASGPLLRGSYTTSVERIQPDGRGQFVDISGQPNAPVRDGEILILKPAVDISVGRVTLQGAVRTPGSFAVDRYKTLHDLLPSMDALQPGAYVLFGFIDRIDPKTLQHEALPFSPLHVIAGSENVDLITYDAIYVLTLSSMQSLLRTSEAQRPNPLAPPSGVGSDQVGTGPAGGANNAANGSAIAGPAALGTAGPGAAAAQAAGGTSASAAQAQGTVAGAAGNVGTTTGATAGAESNSIASRVTSDAGDTAAAAGAAFGNKLTDYRINFDGAVHKPGTYLVAPNTTLAELINVLGGLEQDVDLSRFELTSTRVDNAAGTSSTDRQYYSATSDQLSRLVLQPYDRIEFHHVYSDRDGGTISIEGEVRYPGTYNILRGEHLSSVLQRAGGLTEVAYPYGTVFLRASVAALQSEENKRVAADIRSQLFDVLMRPSSSNAATPSAETVVALQALLTQVQNQPALGRISIVADPHELASNPKLDPILQPDDRIVVPKTPTTISVLGEVMRPGAFPADDSLSARDYVEEAGGLTQFADDSRVVVVLPDGRARVDKQSWFRWSSSEKNLPSGTVIVVPRDVTGLTLHQLVMDTTQIVSQFATTAAALAVLSTNVK